jgi:hypothetical protein
MNEEHYSFKTNTMNVYSDHFFYLTKSTDLIITNESRSDEVSRGEAEVTHNIFEC